MKKAKINDYIRRGYEQGFKDGIAFVKGEDKNIKNEDDQMIAEFLKDNEPSVKFIDKENLRY